MKGKDLHEQKSVWKEKVGETTTRALTKTIAIGKGKVICGNIQYSFEQDKPASLSGLIRPVYNSYLPQQDYFFSFLILDDPKSILK